jgi:hypothetical protein
MADNETRSSAAAVEGSAPQTAPAPEGPSELGLVELSSEGELSSLVKEILDPGRDYPIVCLTARSAEHDPALEPRAVRAIIGPEIPIYLICEQRLTRALSERLPPRFDVWGGAARVWWPGVSKDADPLEHALIYDPSGSYGGDCLERLAAEFATPERPQLTLKQQLVLAERQRAELAGRVGRLERALAEMRSERDEALSATAPAPGQAPPRDTERDEAESAPPANERPQRGESDVEGDLYKLIWSAWVDICPAHERGERPPRRFVLGRELLRTISGRRIDVPIERIAWVCAMVIADRASGHSSIDAHLYRGSDESVRADGARAMRAALKRSAGGPRLHYWALPNGTIEFTQIGYHDLSLPGEARKR